VQADVERYGRTWCGEQSEIVSDDTGSPTLCRTRTGRHNRDRQAQGSTLGLGDARWMTFFPLAASTAIIFQTIPWTMARYVTVQQIDHCYTSAREADEL